MQKYIDYHKRPFTNKISISEYNKQFGTTIPDHPELEKSVHDAHTHGRKQISANRYLLNKFPDHKDCSICYTPEIDLETHLLLDTVDDKDYMFVFGNDKSMLMKGTKGSVMQLCNYLEGDDEAAVTMLNGDKKMVKDLVHNKSLLLSALKSGNGPYYLQKK